ncbi:MAG: hypothetical protein HY712_06760 [candidate division NC10 bacterium]|nr:hypothetical protein [candidate division NC10 bacterium]
MRHRLFGWPDGRRTLLRGGGLLLVVFLAAACGYHRPGRQDPSRPVPTVHLLAFSNDTFRPGLQGAVVAAIQRQLHLDARIPLVEAGRADLILAGRVSGYGVEALAFDQSDIGRRFRVRVVATLSARSRTEERVRFQEEFWGEAYYTAADTVQAVRASEEEAVRRAVQDLATRVAARLLEEW